MILKSSQSLVDLSCVLTGLLVSVWTLNTATGDRNDDEKQKVGDNEMHDRSLEQKDDCEPRKACASDI